MPRIARRGKGPKGSKEKVENVTIPSNVLSSILNKLDLTFERDIGMLNGKAVRNIPDRETLADVQDQLDQLHQLFETISESDQEFIDRLRERRDTRTKEVKSEAEKEQNKIDIEKKDTAEANIPTRDTEENVLEVKDDSEIHITESPKKRSLELDDEQNKEEEQNNEEGKEISTSIVEEQKPIEEINEEPANKKQRTEDVNIDQMENNPNVKNPKSEFVVSQTLPRAARNLGLYSEEGLESTGEEYLKKKYSVASYPTDDLKELLPGDPPDMDLSCAKPANQIQYSTFLSYVDNFYKDLTEEDIKLLKSEYILPANLEVDKTYDPELTPFIIPKLGPLYSRTWFKADANKNIGNTSPPTVNDTSSVVAKKSSAYINETSLETEDISCGPLLSRLLSAVFKDEGNDLAAQLAADSNNRLSIDSNKMSENVDVKEEIATDATINTELDSRELTPMVSSVNTPMGDIGEIAKFTIGGTTSTLKMDQGWRINSVNLDYPTLEERLKRELQYVGIYMNMPKDENNPTGGDPDWLTGREDDEISAELRELQSSLKQVTAKNQNRKKILVPLIKRQLAWQEYSSILEDLDKQIDQAYIKRIRVPKKRKKHHTGNMGVNTGTASQLAQQKAANSSLKALLDKRQRWINKIGPLFGPPELMKRLPKKSIFSNMDQDEEEDEGDVFDQTHDGKDDELEA